MVEEANSGSIRAAVASRRAGAGAPVALGKTVIKAARPTNGEATTANARLVKGKTSTTETPDAKRSSDRTAATRSAAATPAARKAATDRRREPTVPKREACGDVQLGFLSDFVGFHLRLAQDASYRTFAKHHDKDLIKPGRYPAMAIIHLNPGISQSALGRAIARDKSTVSPLIKDLQKNGFISRKASTQDRRSVTLSLTRKGERVLERLHVRATEHEVELDRLVGASKGRLMMLLDKIIAGMAA